MKQVKYGILAFLLVFPLFCSSAHAASNNSSSGIISTALSQLDYEEGENSYSKYGKWYGITNGDWCDMFVSWCANKAGVPKSVFPRAASCTLHVNQFSKIGPYYVSAARGGTYVPKQGDIIFFYNYPKYPYGQVLRHVGIVLCVENGHVFTIEGNTVTNRLDYPYYGSVASLSDPALQPKDYVAVKYYPLDEPQIHGYAVPKYGDTSAFEHTGWVDLGQYESLRKTFDTLAAKDIMPGTSSYTYSPRYGMPRGEFLTAVMKLYGLQGWEAGTEPFDDVPASSAWYGAAMTARSAGIVQGADNKLLPDLYISGDEAQMIISRTLAYVGREDRIFNFTEGDLSYLLTPYTIRADLAKALYALFSEMSEPKPSSDMILFRDEFLDWPMLNIGGSNYVPLELLIQAFSVEAQGPLDLEGEAELSDREEGSEPPAGQTAHLPVPMQNTSWVLLFDEQLQNGDASADVPSFYYQDVQYVMLRPAADLFDFDVRWDGGTRIAEINYRYGPRVGAKRLRRYQT